MRLLKPNVLEKEEWRDVLDGHYQASSFGNVRRKTKFGCGKPLSFWKDKDGYLSFTPSIEGVVKRCSVAKLVAEAFIGTCPKGKQIDHRDTFRDNNYWRNLRYLTQHQNILHRVAMGHNKKQYGELNDNAKLTWRLVKQMREDRMAGYTYRQLEQKYNTSSAYYAVNLGWKAVA